MSKPKTLVVTIPDMISQQDLQPLFLLSDIEYFETSNINEKELAQKCLGFDYLMLNMDAVTKQAGLKLTENFYADPNIRFLKAIAVDMTGMDYFSPKAAAAAGITLLNIPHYSTQSVSETILAEILLHSRQRHLAYVDEINRSQVISRKGINLNGRVAGIVGYGSIGFTVANLLSSIGMKVLIWNKSPKQGVNLVTLEELFMKSDVISISMKTVTEGHEANVNMVNAELLELCKGAIIVNLANESLVEPNAMTNALAKGKVLAYTVESTTKVRNTLGPHPNIHFAPNNSWNSDESIETLRNVWVSNILSIIKGQPQNVYEEK